MAAVSFFPFVAFYFLSHPAVSADDKSNNDIKITCPTSFRCGNSGPPFYFPFSNISNPQCGLCTVFCSEHGESFINFGSEEEFQITEISSTASSGKGSVKVVGGPEFTDRLHPGDCSGLRNFSLPNPLSISFTIPHNLTLFKCMKSSLPIPPARDEYFNYTGCHDFDLYYKKHPLDDHHNVSASADSFHGCDTILLPLTSTPYKTKTEPGEDDDDLLKLLNGTFYIELQASEECLKCHVRGGQCLTINQRFHCTARKNGPNLKLILPLEDINSNSNSNSNIKISCPNSFGCGKFEPLYFPLTNQIYSQCGLSIVFCNEDDQLPQAHIYDPSERFSLNNVTEISSCTNGSSRIKVNNTIFKADLDARNCRALRNLSLPNSASLSFSIPHNLTLFQCNRSSFASSSPTDNLYLNYTGCDDHSYIYYYKYPPHRDNVSYSQAQLFNVCSLIQLPLSSEEFEPGDVGDLFELLTASYFVELQASEDCLKCHRRGGQCQEIGQKFRCTAKTGLIIGTVIGTIALVALIFLFYSTEWKHLSKRILCFANLGKIDDQNVEAFLKSFGSLVPKRYSYLEIKKITNSFNNKLGEGGFGGVYKGKLHDGHLVAVKLLKESKGDGEQFINEVASISRTSHVNIVSLLGFCYESGKRALIYEFMANGSLDKFIHDRNMPKEHDLGLEQLYKIAVGVAKGLEYLHLGCKTRILHFDIKPHNILLDENFCPKIADFGLAKQCFHRESIVSLFGTRGTIGYIAPELFSRNYGGVSYKADVYSYGMMILDMVVGRKDSNDSTFDCSSEMYFPDWIYRRLEEEQEIGLHCITSKEENEKARKMIIVSLWCIQTDPLSRPSMTKVLEMMEGSLHSLHIPPKPFLSSINGPLTHCPTTDGITLCSSDVS
ncbi:LEAF RUST 10 DISEASE-RESISTANCE LOCUS RECEPTOR-LIKE PROTEIN KINASE-like 2.1 isoform X2 [Diospyros lotus]|uniref:LEAF RUST 10 DISEASE-RESISTANCE LOCUS RECEPTOR-LIKE PROTEIN KINASE-like 2.1 isoform X2 n=1 Tax=Diospyros lotus TaxID=55363 RepID=UPI00225651A2|nr:LEAF RUST 10 DISEASE-RESISTANCE LOCUS RECEPTOR-LIKE PROTEIN KINASE-like 2.1 isoform X2 [Diospyros lotus]